MKYLKITIRIALSLALIYFIYTETGPATAIFASLMLVASELTSSFMVQANATMKEMLYLIKGKQQ